MSDQIQDTGSADVVVDQNQGTTQDGQTVSSEGQSYVANDPAAFQADYTRKYQELANERRNFEAEREAFQSQIQGYQGYSKNSQPYTGTQYGYAQQPADQYQQQLVDQFGYEGAQAILQREQALMQQVNNTQFQLLYNQEVMQGKQKFGNDWDKHNYVDPITGQTKNRVMDFRVMVNPLTGKSMTLDQAWAAANNSDLGKVRQEITDKVYHDIQRKAQATPAASSTSAPQSSSAGHARSVAEAFHAALDE